MSDTHNAIFLYNSDGSGTEYGNTGGGSGGGGGHVIENASGEEMTQRSKLQFTGAMVTVTDDSENNATVVTLAKLASEIIPSVNSVTLDKDHLSVDVSLNIIGNGAVSVTSSDPEIATGSILGNTLTITSTNKNKGAVVITVSIAETVDYFASSVNIDVDTTAFPVKKTFAAATDEEIAEMVIAADQGVIDLYNDCGWRVGQEHQITLGTIAASGSYDGTSWSVGETHDVVQTVTLVLLHRGTGLSSNQCGLVSPVKDVYGADRYLPSFVVGLKNCLLTGGYMNSSDTNAGSWNSCARRPWCNGGFRQAIPEVLRPLFKKFKTITASEYNASTVTQSQDYFALLAEKEIFGGKSYSNDTEVANLTQFDYYKDWATRIKKAGDNGSAVNWWERSPIYNTWAGFCSVLTNGTAYINGASLGFFLSPFGCL